MSKPQRLIADDAIAGASVDALLATARALVGEAVAKVRTGTVGTSRAELVEQVVACQQLQNATWATQSIRLAQIAAIEELVPSDGRPREVRHAVGTHTDEWLPQELGTRLGWSDRQTVNRLTDAVEAMRDTPAIFDLTAEGALDPRKLTGIADTLCGASRRATRKVEVGLLAEIEHAVSDAQDPDCEQSQCGLVPLTSTKLVRRARRLLAEAEPADADVAAARRRANAKGVRAYPHQEPGLSCLHAVLPSVDAMRIMAGVNELAGDLHQDTTTDKCLDECRVDALVDLMLGSISVQTTCVVQIPVVADPDSRTRAEAPVTAVARPKPLSQETPRLPPSTGEARVERMLQQAVDDGIDVLTTIESPLSSIVIRQPCDLDDLINASSSARFAPRVKLDPRPRDASCRQRQDVSMRTRSRRRRDPMTAPARSPADVQGLRHCIGDVVVEGLGVIPASVLHQLCQTLGVKLTRALVDGRTGTTLETSDHSYRPGSRLRRFVVTRDQHCRFPGCTRPARLDDVDHVTRWPEGPTAAWNLQCLCRHHHRAKHEGGWQVWMTADGVCTWTSPFGRVYVTRPADRPGRSG